MKTMNYRNFFLSLFFLTTLGLMVSGCKDNSLDDNSDGDTCLVGSWYFTEDGFEKSFTFNDDNTGVEIQAADDVRNFTWEMKDGKPVIVYVNESAEWNFTLDCDQNTLTILMASYKKK